jgi:bacillithiol biosynthesis deacetylase BshB1
MNKMTEQQPIDWLVIGAHPDDAEIGMGGTIAKHTDAGVCIVVCDLTEAEMSSNGTVESRRLEAAKASEILGLAGRDNLRLPDRGLSYAKEQIDLIVLEIRKRRPSIVFAPYWEDRHPDHVMCSRMVQEAVFNAKLRNYLPESPAHTVGRLFFYYINDMFEPQVMVDISDYTARKAQALMAYETQFASPGAGQDFVATPLNQGYLERVEARDRLLGQKALIASAEGFVGKLPYLVNYF